MESKEQELAFNIGVTQPSQKAKVKTSEEIAEMRRKETFQTNLGESTKRIREDYAVKLRKERR